MEGTHQRRYWQGACLAPSKRIQDITGRTRIEACMSHWHQHQVALCSVAAGVQNMPGRKGELWGIANLLSYTGDTIKTLDVIDTHRQKV